MNHIRVQTTGLTTKYEADMETNTSFILEFEYMQMLINKDKMNLDLSLCSFSPVRSPCQFSGTLYARSTLTAHAPLKTQGTQFNSEDDEERNYTFKVVAFCTAVLITEQ